MSVCSNGSDGALRSRHTSEAGANGTRNERVAQSVNVATGTRRKNTHDGL